jgi:hypothetical protein
LYLNPIRETNHPSVLLFEPPCVGKVLYLGYNGIGDEGAISIADMLKTNTVLTTLDLRGNKIGKLQQFTSTPADLQCRSIAADMNFTMLLRARAPAHACVCVYIVCGVAMRIHLR